MTWKRREKNQFDMFSCLVISFFFVISHFFHVVSWQLALEFVVVVLAKEKCNSP